MAFQNAAIIDAGVFSTPGAPAIDDTEPEPPTVEPEPVLGPLTVELSAGSRAVLTALATSIDGLTAALNRFNR